MKISPTKFLLSQNFYAKLIKTGGSYYKKTLTDISSPKV